MEEEEAEVEEEASAAIAVWNGSREKRRERRVSKWVSVLSESISNAIQSSIMIRGLLNNIEKGQKKYEGEIRQERVELRVIVGMHAAAPFTCLSTTTNSLSHVIQFRREHYSLLLLPPEGYACCNYRRGRGGRAIAAAVCEQRLCSCGWQELHERTGESYISY
jgi:hypothetical protein